MLYPEDLELSEQARVAGLEAFSANAGDKATPHIIQRFVNIYDHLATTLFDRKILSSLYPAQSGERFTIQQLTHAQKKFRDHVDRYGYMNMSACPVPSVVGLKTSLLDYSIALSNYTDFGIRVEKGLDQTYRLLAEILNADDALSSLSTTSRLTGIDTHLKYRARYNADMQKNIGETQATTEIPYGKLVRSNKEMIQTFDHRNGFEKTLDEKTKNNIENLVSKIAMLMNNVANDVASSDAAVNGRVVSALSNLLFEVGQMTRDYGTYLFRINAFIGVVDGVIAEATNFTPEHVKRAVEEAEAVAGNNGFELAQYDAGLNAFNAGALGKLIVGVILAIIAAVVGLIALGKKANTHADNAAGGMIKEIRDVIAEKPFEKVKTAAAQKPAISKEVVALAHSGKPTIAGNSSHSSNKPAEANKIPHGEEKATANIARLLMKLEDVWNHMHNVENYPDAPKFNGAAWLRDPKLPYQVRSPQMDQFMSASALYADEQALQNQAEEEFAKFAADYVVQVERYKEGYQNFLKAIATKQPIMKDVHFVTDYMSGKKGDEQRAVIMTLLKKMYLTSSEAKGESIPPEVSKRLEKYTKVGNSNELGFADASRIEANFDRMYELRKSAMDAVEKSKAGLDATEALCKQSVKEIQRATADNAELTASYAPHIKELRSAGLMLGGMVSTLNAYYARTTSEETTIVLGLRNLLSFVKTSKEIGDQMLEIQELRK